jgi:hypothetical protein
MRLSHAIGAQTFTYISSVDLRQSLGCFASNEEYQVEAFHPPGAQGNVTIWAGRRGQQIVANQRYVGSAAEVLAAYAADNVEFSSAPVAIYDSNGTEFLRCRILRMNITKPCLPVASDTPKCVMETEAIFTRDS